MIKLTYKDGKEQTFPDADDWNFGNENNHINIIKHDTDEEGDYDEDEDEIIASINCDEFRIIECQ